MGSRDDPVVEGAHLLQTAPSYGSSVNGTGPLPFGRRAGAIGGRLKKAVRHCVQHEPLLLATLVGVATGVVLGTALSFAGLSPLALEVIGLPGDLLMRLLKMLVLPLITASVMAGVCALRQSTADMGKVARYTLLYYFTTTMGAVVLGIAIVNIVKPGRNAPFDQLDPSSSGGAGGNCHAANQAKVASHAASAGQHSPVEAFLGVIKSAFPDNIFQAAANMNVLGIITVSLLMGAALSSMGPEAAPMVALINVFNEAIGKIVNWVIWTSPVGIASLITTSICRACHLGATLEALGLFIVAVLLGLLIWGFMILPAVYYATTRRNPAQVYRGFSQAMATAFGTDSSNATLPITMRSAVHNLGCDPRVVQFFLPLGTTVNMNGTALYEAVTVIFIAQAHGVVLGAAGTVIVALTATLAAVGAAGIPSAGLVTMLMVLQAVDLEQFAGDIAIILAVDWFLDRCRTVVNVLGDSFGTVIIDHHARNWVIGGRPPPSESPVGPGADKPAADPTGPAAAGGEVHGKWTAGENHLRSSAQIEGYRPVTTNGDACDTVAIELSAAAPVQGQGPRQGQGPQGQGPHPGGGGAGGFAAATAAAAPYQAGLDLLPNGSHAACYSLGGSAAPHAAWVGAQPDDGTGPSHPYNNGGNNNINNQNHHKHQYNDAHPGSGMGTGLFSHLNHHRGNNDQHPHQHHHSRPAGLSGDADGDVRQRLLAAATSLEEADMDGLGNAVAAATTAAALVPHLGPSVGIRGGAGMAGGTGAGGPGLPAAVPHTVFQGAGPVGPGAGSDPWFSEPGLDSDAAGARSGAELYASSSSPSPGGLGFRVTAEGADGDGGDRGLAVAGHWSGGELHHRHPHAP